MRFLSEDAMQGAFGEQNGQCPQSLAKNGLESSIFSSAGSLLRPSLLSFLLLLGSVAGNMTTSGMLEILLLIVKLSNKCLLSFVHSSTPKLGSMLIETPNAQLHPGCIPHDCLKPEINSCHTSKSSRWGPVHCLQGRSRQQMGGVWHTITLSVGIAIKSLQPLWAPRRRQFRDYSVGIICDCACRLSIHSVWCRLN